MGDLSYLRDQFAKVGWFIPPYIQLGALNRIAKRIQDQVHFDLGALQSELDALYDAPGLAAMVLERYPKAPIINCYCATIAEAVEAHFLGLDHVAVAGLIPVIEGAGRQLANARSLKVTSVKDVFAKLASDCADEARTRALGAVDEVVSMLNSFATFTADFLYASSAAYPLDDGTNRHGITHGAYSDADYGSPLNFYKTVASVDFLTFVSSFRANVSWLAPNTTPSSLLLARYYLALAGIRKLRPRAS